MRTTKIRNNQTLLDLALQTSGSAEEVFSLALLNGLGITDDITTGGELLSTSVVDGFIIEQYVSDAIMPATAIAVEDILEGIDYWTLSIDFKIS